MSNPNKRRSKNASGRITKRKGDGRKRLIEASSGRSRNRDKASDRKNRRLAKEMGLHASELGDGPVTVERVLDVANNRDDDRVMRQVETDLREKEEKRKAEIEAEKVQKRRAQFAAHEARLERAAKNKAAQDQRHQEQRKQREEAQRKQEEAQRKLEEAAREAKRLQDEANAAQVQIGNTKLSSLLNQVEKSNHKLANIDALKTSITGALAKTDFVTAQKTLDDFDKHVQQLLGMDLRLATIESDASKLPLTGPNSNGQLTDNITKKIADHRANSQLLNSSDPTAFSKAASQLLDMEKQLTQYNQTIANYKTPQQIQAEKAAANAAKQHQKLETLEQAAWNNMIANVTVNGTTGRVQNAGLLSMDIMDKDIRAYLSSSGNTITLNNRTYQKSSSNSAAVSYKTDLPANKRGTNSQGIERRTFIIHLLASH